MFDWIAFDADDTLWKNEEYYREGRKIFAEILAKYGVDHPLPERVDQLESSNIRYYGYGVMSFVLSLIDISIQETGGKIQAEDIQKLLELSKNMLSRDVEVMAGVEDLLAALQERYPLMLVTKGDLFHQQRKIAQSGLESYFRAVEVVSEKNPRTYQAILDKHRIKPDRFVMIGNSLRSDVLPVLEIGGWALYLSDHLSWSHEDGSDQPLPKDRFLEISSISEVGSALAHLTGK